MGYKLTYKINGSIVHEYANGKIDNLEEFLKRKTKKRKYQLETGVPMRYRDDFEFISYEEISDFEVKEKFARRV